MILLKLTRKLKQSPGCLCEYIVEVFAIFLLLLCFSTKILAQNTTFLETGIQKNTKLSQIEQKQELEHPFFQGESLIRQLSMAHDQKVTLMSLNNHTEDIAHSKVLDTSGFKKSIKNINIEYQKIMQSDRLLQSEIEGLLKTLAEAGFHPSPNGLRVILALSEQKSGLEWNPVLSTVKKGFLKTKFDSIIKKVDDSMIGTIAGWILPDDFNQHKASFIQRFKNITDPQNKKITEIDVYNWGQQVLSLLEDPHSGSSHISDFERWFFDLDRAVGKLKYYPQTFGLWQINVNHFLIKLKKNKTLPLFSEIYQTAGQQKIIKRSSLIKSMSGLKGAPLNREKTLILIVKYYLKPLYEMHMQGHPDDLLFFITENLTGELSTYKAAIQRTLNEQLGSKLILDGDLVFYKPYSQEIDWVRKSKTQNQMRSFIDKYKNLFIQPVIPAQLIKNLCEADTLEELKLSELYRQIMRNDIGRRVYPGIKSNFHQQYANDVLEHALKYY